jgi:phosphoribosylformylglycinamidine synthase subunit PurQ / glutaminase
VTCGIVVFPGSNCDSDAFRAVTRVLGHEARFLWHKDRDLAGVDRLILPGGFSYGDYLRAGALARFSPIMEEVARFSARGGPTLGICNGFQILCEAGLLPGALARNASLLFACRDVRVRVESTDSPLTRGVPADRALRMPIAHAEGNFTLADAELDALEQNGQVVLRYCDEALGRSPAANPNGSARHIAGVRNRAGNVVGLMPHPERACEALLQSAGTGGSEDGRLLMEAFLS